MAGEWREVTLGEITENFDGRRVPVKEADRRRGSYPYYGASGIVDYVDDYLFDGEYLLIAEDGENLRTRATPVAFLARGKFWVNNHAHIVRGNGRSDTRFLMYALAVADIGGYLTGSAMPKLTQGHMNRIELSIPERTEQRAIAHILGMLDDRIEANRRMAATLEEMARALFRSWFVTFDPVRAKAEGRWRPGQTLPGLPASLYDAFPDRLVETEHGQIPKGCKSGSIYDVANVIYGAPFASERFNTEGRGVPLIRIRDLKSEAPGVWTDERHPKGYLVQPGDIVVGMDGEFRAYVWGSDPAWLNQRVCVFQPKAGCSAAQVRNLIVDPLAFIEATQVGTTVIHLGKKDIDNFKITVPAPKISEHFGRLAQPWYDKLVSIKLASRTLGNIRDLLLPKLVSGAIRVKDAEAFLKARGL